MFTLPQIEAIEQEFGVLLLTVPQVGCAVAVKTTQSWTDATFVVEGRKIPCQVALGGGIRAVGQRFVAFISKGHWYIHLADEYSGSDPLFAVSAMRIATSL